ncbi:MAG: wax ester/triacylglycerol synthase family O-acyltransferase [Myxococcota bacterium]|jgi:WS/DGAT/MGAT family acyltransferase|nr:wax ester/triacylglycerol synthase family O-acyltransferase [Myxococcota bacterium]
MRQVSGMDEFFLYFERSGLPMHVGSLAVFDCSTSPGGVPTFAQIRQSLRRGAERSPMLQKRLLDVPTWLDRPYWLEAQKLEIDDHVRHVKLSHPRSWARFCSEVARLFESPLDLDRPLWETLVITDLDGIEGMPPSGFAVLTKAHHVVLDGVAGVELMTAFLDESPEPVRQEPVDRRRPDEPPGVLELTTRAVTNRLNRAGSAAGLAARTLPTMLKEQADSWTTQVEREDETASSTDTVGRTTFNGRPTAARVFGGIRLELDAVQLLREGAKGATVNDVILAICGGALRDYLQATEDLPAQPLVAMAPVSIREAGTETEGGNRVSMMSTTLGSEIADPLARLQHVCGAARSSKKQGSSTGATTMLDIAELIPSALGHVAAQTYRTMDLSSRHAPFFNCVVTNVPGPREPLYLAGAKMVSNYGIGPIFDGMGLIHPVLSYDDSITIAFTSCPSMIREPALYTECLRSAFEELRAAVETKKAPEGEARVLDLRRSEVS